MTVRKDDAKTQLTVPHLKSIKEAVVQAAINVLGMARMPRINGVGFFMTNRPP